MPPSLRRELLTALASLTCNLMGVDEKTKTQNCLDDWLRRTPDCLNDADTRRFTLSYT